MYDKKVKNLLDRLEGIQKKCSHTFELNKFSVLKATHVEHTFSEQTDLEAECTSCAKKIKFSTWDVCPVCFNDISMGTTRTERDLSPYLHFSRYGHAHIGLIKMCHKCQTSILRLEYDR